MMKFLHGKKAGQTYFDENVVRAEDGFITSYRAFSASGVEMGSHCARATLYVFN